MRALLRTVTGSPRAASISSSPSSSKGTNSKGKGKAAAEYSVADVQKAWEYVRSTLERSSESASIKDNKQKEPDALLLLNRQIDVLVDALASEASTYALDDSTGPCLEYLLTNDVLPSLVTLALPDKPVGILGGIIKAFDTLIVLLGDDFVALASRSLSKLLKGCFDLPANSSTEANPTSPTMQRTPSTNYRADLYSAHLSSLLCGVCSRMKAHPDLLPIFFHEKRLAKSGSERDDPPAYSAATSASKRTLEILRSPASSTRSLSTAASASPSASSSSARAEQADISILTSPGTAIASIPSSFDIEKLAKSYDLPILAYLLRYSHRDGRTGEFARAGVLFLVDLATGGEASTNTKTERKTKRRMRAVEEVLRPSSSPAAQRPNMDRNSSSSSYLTSSNKPTDLPLRSILASYIAQSDLADVLGAGLGALYGLLPSKVHIPSKPFSLRSSGEIEVLSPALSKGDVFDASAQEATDEEERLRDLRSEGYAIMGDEDFGQQLEEWSKLLAFGQDVARGATVGKEEAGLAEKVLASIGTAFLQNTLYPSILESSTQDGSGTAILVYLEAMLTVLETDGALSECILFFLLAIEIPKPSVTTSSGQLENVFSPPLSPTFSAATSASPSRVKKQIRNGLLTLDDGSTGIQAAPLGNSEATFRFTLKDLLLQHLSPMRDRSNKAPEADSQSPSSLLALRIIHLMLSKFDYLALEVLDIIPDLAATKFPFDTALLEVGELASQNKGRAGEEDEEDEDFVYPGDDGSDAESFTYSSQAGTLQLPPAPQGQNEKRENGPSELEFLLRLVPSSDSSTFEHGSSSHSYAKYLQDAQSAVSQDVSFRRGIAIASAFERTISATQVNKAGVSASVAMSSNTVGNISSESHLSATSSTLSAVSTNLQQDATFDPMLPHPLFPSAPLMKHLIQYLAHFFANPPNINLVITAIFAKLASCPYRSLQDWLVPKDNPLRKLGESGLLPFSLSEEESAKGTNTPFQIFQSTLSVPKARYNSSLAVEDAAVFGILGQLLAQVDQYRRVIRGFDKYLKERREGLSFVEDLAEAIGGDELTGHGLPRPSMARSTSSSFTGSMGTPTRAKKGSKSSLFARQDAIEQKAALSPYANRYAQTSEIQVQAWIISLPDDLSGMSKTWTSSTVSSGISDSGNETPTKTVFTRQKSQGKDTSVLKKKEISISLSVLLDNVIILEEAVKELVALVAVRKSLGIDDV